MDGRFLHAGGQLVTRGHQAMILISMLGAPTAAAWEVSSRRSGTAADIFGFW